MSLTQLPLSPTVANIDQDLDLLVNWTPPQVNGGYSAYLGWNILLATPPTNTPVTTFTTGLQFGGTISSPSFEETLSVGEYGLNMQAIAALLSPPLYSNSNFWDSQHTFPPAVTSAFVTWDNPTLLLGQTLTITLGSAYPTTNVSGNPIAGWQVIYQDGTTSGFLPITNRVVTKIFNTPGQQNIVVQTLCDYSANNPPVKLTRSFAFSVFVMNQQYSAAANNSITGTLGVSGEAGFEIIDNTSVATAPQPYEVIVRSLVRDTITNELKLLIATSRYSNASSLLGTMAADVFPLSGRPQAQEILEPLTEVTAANSTTSVIKITTTALPSNSYVGIPMLDFKMAAIGGNTPYSWFATGLPPGLKMSIDGTITGTPTQLGTFNVNFAASDSSSPAFIAETTLVFTIPTNLTITTPTLPAATVLTPYNVPVVNTGGLFPFIWSIQGGILPIGLFLNPSTGVISGTPCTYSLADFSGPFVVTIQVQDAVGALASKTYNLTLSPAALQLGPVDQPTIFAGPDYRIEVPIFGGQSPYSFVSFIDDGTFALNPNGDNAYGVEGGQFELQIGVPNTQANKTHNFSVAIQDSASTPANKTLYYAVGTELSNILMTQAAFDHVWEAGDTESLAHPIVGSLQGFQINQGSLFTVPGGNFTQPDGLTVTVNPDLQSPTSPPLSPPVIGPAIEVAGPPSSPYNNSEVKVPILLTNGTATVATISRTFSLLTQGAAIACYPRPYQVSNFVALNPQRPYFNSPDVDLTPGTLVRVQTGSALPLGLSLDQNTGLVYGTLLATYGSLSGGNNLSILEYLIGGVVQGTITIHWDTLSGFTITGTLPNGTLQTPYSQTLNSTSANNLVSASVYRGSLPAGLSLAVATSTITLSGNPQESGYFDIWIKATDSAGNVGYSYQRLAIVYITPLTILTSTLPACVETVAYNQTLQGYGGVSPYTWSSDIATSFAGLAAYISLNPSTGALTGTVPSGSGLNGQSRNVTFTLTDSNLNTTNRIISMSVNNALSITTSAVAPITLAQPYSFQMQAVGGIPPYTWTTTFGSLPTSITIDSSGVISGTTSDGGYGTQSVTFQVTDSTFVSATQGLPVTVGVVSGMTIDSSGVGTINRGSNYLGTLAVNGTYTTPVSWSVTSDSPNALPSGLSLTASSSNNGQTARITGLYTGIAFTGYMVKVQAVDIAGHLATTVLSLTAASNLAITTSSPLPTATVGVTITPIQFTATGGGSPSGGAPSYIWSIPSPPVGFPFILSSGGLFTGTAGVVNTWTFTVSLSDGMSPADNVTKIFTISSSTSTLAISTSSPLPQGTAGVAYNQTLVATGGTAPYTWAIVGGGLPTGLSLNPSTGAITGTTTSVGTANVTFQVTDNVSSQVQKAFTLNIITGLSLFTGIDYTNSLTLKILGYITAIDNVATITGPNDSFFVIATGVIATSPGQLTVNVPAGYSAVVQSIIGGVALIKLSGPFSSGSVGSNNFSLTVNDVGGVNASATFTWIVYTSNAMRLAPSVGAIPAYGVPLLEGATVSLPIYNSPSLPTFTYPTFNGQSPDGPLAASSGEMALSGDTTAYQGLVSLAALTGPAFNLAYNGNAFVSGVALNNLTVKELDIAWFNAHNSTLDLFATGVLLNFPSIYLVKPTVASIQPNTSPGSPITIPPSNIAYSTIVSGPPQTETEIPSAYVGWTSYGNLKNSGQDTITLFGSNNTVDTSQTLDLTNFLLGLPSNATVTQVVVNATVNQSAGTSATYLNANLTGVSGTVNQTQIHSGGVNNFFFSGTWTAAQLNAAGFGVAFYMNCTNAPGTGAILQFTNLTLSVTYWVPVYNNITVNLSKPFSPYQQGTLGGTGNSIAASASMTNGVSVVSVTPNYTSIGGQNWLSGWTIQVQYPSGSGSLTSVLSMNVTGVLTWFSGSSLTSGGAVTYISGNIGTIYATYGGGGG